MPDIKCIHSFTHNYLIVSADAMNTMFMMLSCADVVEKSRQSSPGVDKQYRADAA